MPPPVRRTRPAVCALRCAVRAARRRSGCGERAGGCWGLQRRLPAPERKERAGGQATGAAAALRTSMLSSSVTSSLRIVSRSPWIACHPHEAAAPLSSEALLRAPIAYNGAHPPRSAASGSARLGRRQRKTPWAPCAGAPGERGGRAPRGGSGTSRRRGRLGEAERGAGERREHGGRDRRASDRAHTHSTAGGGRRLGLLRHSSTALPSAASPRAASGVLPPRLDSRVRSGEEAFSHRSALGGLFSREAAAQTPARYLAMSPGRRSAGGPSLGEALTRGRPASHRVWVGRCGHARSLPMRCHVRNTSVALLRRAGAGWHGRPRLHN